MHNIAIIRPPWLKNFSIKCRNFNITCVLRSRVCH